MPKARVVRRGACSKCGYSYRLRRDGSIGVHHLYSGSGRYPDPCEGSGRPPKPSEPASTEGELSP
jgi:hypothetical protein